MQSGEYSTSDVQQLLQRVVVNGIQRECVSWSTDRELSGDLPAQVVATSGITQATGTVVWNDGPDVAEKPVHPFNPASGWLPTKGDRIEIYVGDGTTEWRQFTGIVDKTTGSIGEGFQSTIIDDYDRLAAPVTHEPMLAVMPPSTPGGAFRGTGLVHTYYVDLAMRAGKFLATPGREANSAIHVPCQGGMWPHYGQCVLAGTHDGASYPSNNYAPWGFAVGNFNSTYLSADPRPASDGVQLTFMVAPSHNGFYYMRASYGSTYVQLSINSNWIVSAIIGGTTVASFTLPGKGTAQAIIQMLVKGGTVRLKSSTGQSSTGSASFSGSTLMGTITVSGDAATRVAGIQISHPTVTAHEFATLGFQPTGRINTSNTTLMGIPPVVPAIEGQPASDLIDEMSKSTLSAPWIDELGTFQWWPALALRARPSYDTLDTRNDIFDLAWEDSILSSRSTVTVKYEESALRISRWQNVELAVGSGETLGSGDKSEQFFTPADNQVWIMPDYIQSNVAPGNWAEYNAKRGTLVGGYFTQDNDETGSVYPVSVSNERLGVTGAMKMTHTAGTFPTGVEAVLKTSPTDPALKIQNRDKPLPRIAGHALAEFLMQEYTAVTPGGIGPALIHETGKWIPKDIVGRVADFLASETAVPQPVITDLDVVYDPRRQLADMVTIESRKYMGVTMTALVCKVSNSGDANGVTQSLAVRTASITRSSRTYQEVNASLPGSQLTYAQFQALGPVPESYEHFNDAV